MHDDVFDLIGAHLGVGEERPHAAAGVELAPVARRGEEDVRVRRVHLQSEDADARNAPVTFTWTWWTVTSELSTWFSPSVAFAL